MKKSEYIGFTLADRDLIVELKTEFREKIGTLTGLVTEIKSSTAISIQNLQQNSVSRIVTDEQGNSIKDHENRIRSNERWLYMLAGAFVLLQVEMPIIFYLFR